MFNFDPEDPRKAAMMAFAAQLMAGRGSLGQSAGQGLMGAMGAYRDAGLMKDRKSQETQEREMRSMQMDQIKRGLLDQDAVRNAYSQNTMPGNLAPNDDEGNPMPQAPQGLNMEGLMGSLGTAGPAGMRERAMVQSQMPKPEEPNYQFAPDGSVVNMKRPDTSRNYAKPAGPAPTREIKVGRMIYTQEHDGKEWKTIGKSAMDAPDKPEKPERAMPGYRWADGGSRMEPIPGGPADAKAGAQAEAADKRVQGNLGRADMVLGKINEAIGQTGFSTTGTLGSIGAKIPGTGARNLSKTLETIKANIGFAELQAMREASPTGGALGQVAVQELNSLQAVLGSLDQEQSQDQLLKNLYAIERHYNKWKQTVSQSRQPQQPQGGGKVVDWNELK